MNTLAHEPPHRFPLAGRIAAFLAGAIAIAALVLAISAQGFDGGVAPATDLGAAGVPAGGAPAVPNLRCAECGVIQSVQEIKAADQISAVHSLDRVTARSRSEIKAKPLRNYEITIRMQDGSMRVITDAKPAHWREGEPVIIIAGVD